MSERPYRQSLTKTCCALDSERVGVRSIRHGESSRLGLFLMESSVLDLAW